MAEMAEQQKRLNTFVAADTYQKVKIVAAETGNTISFTVNALLGLGVQNYVDGKGFMVHEPKIERRPGLSPEKKRVGLEIHQPIDRP